jgi:hypothetical protein
MNRVDYHGAEVVTCGLKNHEASEDLSSFFTLTNRVRHVSSCSSPALPGSLIKSKVFLYTIR